MVEVGNEFKGVYVLLFMSEYEGFVTNVKKEESLSASRKYCLRQMFRERLVAQITSYKIYIINSSLLFLKLVDKERVSNEATYM